MIGTFTTESWAEFKANPDLIYLPPSIFLKVKNITPRRCKICSAILGRGQQTFCSQICKDDNDVKTVVLNKCKYCDNNTEPTFNKKTEYVANYNQVCEECKVSRKEETKQRNLNKREEKKKANRIKRNKKKDLVMNDRGRVCSKCGEFKKWDLIMSVKRNKNGKGSACLACMNEYSKNYYRDVRS